jgi:hypothetical protein
MCFRVVRCWGLEGARLCLTSCGLSTLVTWHPTGVPAITPGVRQACVVPAMNAATCDSPRAKGFLLPFTFPAGKDSDVGSEVRSGPMLARNRYPSLGLSNCRGVMDLTNCAVNSSLGLGGFEVAFVLLVFSGVFPIRSPEDGTDRRSLISLAWLCCGKTISN